MATEANPHNITYTTIYGRGYQASNGWMIISESSYERGKWTITHKVKNLKAKEAPTKLSEAKIWVQNIGQKYVEKWEREAQARK